MSLCYVYLHTMMYAVVYILNIPQSLMDQRLGPESSTIEK